MAKASETLLMIRTSVTAARRLRRIFERERIHVSNVPLSVVPYVFLRKAFHVHEAVMALCKAGMASEAYALSRIMVEMFITLRWITNQNQNARAKDYGFFAAKRKEYWAKILQSYYPMNPESADELKYVERLYGRYVAMYKSSIFWARENLRKMAEEPEQVDTASRKNALWDYEIPYSMTSDHVHATVAALDELVPIQGTAFKVSRVENSKLTASAAFTATAWLFNIAARVDKARKLELASAITKAHRPFELLVTGQQVQPERRARKIRRRPR